MDRFDPRWLSPNQLRRVSTAPSRPMIAGLATLAFVGCAGQALTRPPTTPAATVVGAPQSCISLPQLRETRIRDDWTIDFIGNGRVWRNTLTSRCPGLKVNDAITYETSLSQLCNTDIVYVLEMTVEPHRGVACGLSQFVPVRLER